MNFEFRIPNTSISPRAHPYASALSSSASSSTSSVFSVEGFSSQSSTSSFSSVGSWEAEEGWPARTQFASSGNVDAAGSTVFAPINRAQTFPSCQPSVCQQPVAPRGLPTVKLGVPLPAEQRQHPRRSSTTVNNRPPPALVRQCERKGNFVDSLVDSATVMVEVIWPLSVPACRAESAKGILPLRTFIQETLRRSRTSYSTLQVALYYLILIKPHVPKHDFTMEQPADTHSLRALQCGRRMFLAALILASKYLQDRNYSARAWCKISGLKVSEINTNELAFLDAVNWKLHVPDTLYEKWQELVIRYTPIHPSGGLGIQAWRSLVPHLTPGLDTVCFKPRSSPRSFASELRVQSQSPLPASMTASQENTPTPAQYGLPRYLEPKPDMLPPTPTLARLGPLPTPQLTPQSIASSTPAASALANSTRRPSMCVAMAHAQTSSLSRCVTEQWIPPCNFGGLEAYQLTGRRSSLAQSTTSSSSSPESMVSDNSRSSRASSISSVSSACWAPHQAKLARLATCRNARLPYPVVAQKKENCQLDLIPQEPMSSPDLEGFHLDDMSPIRRVPTAPTPSPPRFDTEATKTRKRCRSSADLMQQNVRQMLCASSLLENGDMMVLPDRTMPVTVTVPCNEDMRDFEARALQSPKGFPQERRLPIQKDLGRKRTCCASEAVSFNGLHRGPSMWDGIL